MLDSIAIGPSRRCDHRVAARSWWNIPPHHQRGQLINEIYARVLIHARSYWPQKQTEQRPKVDAATEMLDGVRASSLAIGRELDDELRDVLSKQFARDRAGGPEPGRG